MKKAQGLPLNTIIIAIIVIVVLFVVILIFRGIAGEPSKLYAECGQGIYAELTCVDDTADTYSSPLCAGADAEKGCGENMRCCPPDEG